jgi:YD repeat-containing protein
MFTGRLIDVDENSSAYSDYTYDDNSNRTSGNIGGTSFSAVYDAHDRLTDWGVYD